MSGTNAWMKSFLMVAMSWIVGPGSLTAAEPKLDGAQIEKLTGLKGTLNEEDGVFKVTSPRVDMKFSVDDWSMPPFLGLTSWAAFQAGKAEAAMVMGDLVLCEDEVNPVLSVLLEAGLNVTALHNHFFFDDPRVYFLHIGGEGSVEKLSTGVRKALDKVREIRTAQPKPGRTFGAPLPAATNAITAKPVEDTLGVKGQSKDGMFKAVIGRKVEMACGCTVGKDMGVNTWAAFAGSDEQAVVDGDFAVLEDELRTVLKSLRGAGINIVAIHHHMTSETPRMLFLHYWGKGKALDLARAVRSALDAQGLVGKDNVKTGDTHAKTWNFDADKAGEAAKGFSTEVGEWKVVADDSAPSKSNALAQTAKNSGSTFNLALVADSNFKDVAVSVQMKAIAGDEDQGGGIVWRAKDAKNYYIARFNPLEDNYRLYKVVEGRRIQLGSADIKAAPGWHTLKVEMIGDHIECHFDEKKHLDAKDDTFKDAGKIGLWSKADAQSRFDDLRSAEVGGSPVVPLSK